ncbi:ABC transporter substrate-binding protein [Halosimplex amylolyticum]|uniref:ABC transporter substrate-binding protein n=1 Tax=Halosimplex amylolyticum TaxID=3396616 RepID=UPI003F571643
MTEKQSANGNRKWSRRQFTAYVSALAAGLAGCSGDGNETEAPGGDTSTSMPTDTPVAQTTVPPGGGEETDTPTSDETETAVPETDKVYRSVMRYDPSKVQWTKFAQTSGAVKTPWSILGYFYEKTMARNPRTGAFEDGIVTDLDITDKKLTYQFHPDHSWSDGKPIDSKDWGTLLYLVRHDAERSISQVRSEDVDVNAMTWVEAITDFEFNGKELVLHSEPGYFKHFRNLVYYDWAFFQAGTYHWKYLKEYYKKIEAMDDPWSDANRKKIQEMKPNIPPFGWGYEEPDPKEVPTSGVFTPKEAKGSKKLICDINEGHRHADKFNFEGAEFFYRPEERAIWAQLKSGDLSAASPGTVPGHIVDSFPDKYSQVISKTPFGTALGLNWQHDMFKEREVRAALRHVVNTDLLAKNLHPDIESGVTRPPTEITSPSYSSESWANKHVTYENGDGTQRAAQLLKQANFSKQGGTWVKPDGTEFSFSIMTDADTPTAASTITDQLSSFGIKVDVETVNSSVYEQRFQKTDFQANVREWGFQQQVNSVGYLQWAGPPFYQGEGDNWDPYGMWAANGIDVKETIEQTDGFELTPEKENPYEFRTNEALKPFTIKVPPIGDVDGEPTLELPLPYWAHQFPKMSNEKQTEVIRKAHWAKNWAQPQLMLTLTGSQIFIDSENWSHPPKDSVQWRYNWWMNPLMYNMNGGNIQAKPD